MVSRQESKSVKNESGFLLRKAMRKVARSLKSRTEDLVVRKHLKCIGLHHAEKIFTYTTKQELQALLDLALMCPMNAKALEIGSHLGASTCYLAAGLATKDGHLYCVDTWQNETMPEGESDTLKEFQANTENVKGLLTLCRKRSGELSAGDISLPLDLVFIDGDHSYEAAKEDFERVAPWIADTGIIAFHDCLYFEGVSRVIGEALASGRWVMAGHVHNLFWIKRSAFPYK